MAINYHMDLGSLATRELKRALRDGGQLAERDRLRIQAELLRRGQSP